MPWFTRPDMTCRVLDKIARRCERMTIQELKSVLDDTAAAIWKKQEHYLSDTRQRQ